MNEMSALPISFTTEPWPISPQWIALDPIAIITGISSSCRSRGPPVIRMSVPFSAPIFEPVTGACDGCRAAVSYVDETGGGDHFRCNVIGEGDERMADLELYHRPELPADSARSWARSTVAGHPASALAGEHLFVWPGRFEIRAFGRSASLRSDQALESLVTSLPLDELAKL